MARNSSIEWTHHTFNPWWGCAKVSPACKHCYAEAWAKRVGQGLWGVDEPRRFFSEKHWRGPLAWNDEAARLGVRQRVFCASMADVFEDRDDLDPSRQRLWKLIADTPWLCWLLLTKRPQNVKRTVPWSNEWPDNVWIGTTIENAVWARKRLPSLAALPARVRFVSCEPLLGSLDLGAWLARPGSSKPGVNWVIAGGESGARARPLRAEWARELRDQCAAAGVPFHFKQWGEWLPLEDRVVRAGKKNAGRVLDERTWDGVPDAGRPHTDELGSGPRIALRLAVL